MTNKCGVCFVAFLNGIGAERRGWVLGGVEMIKVRIIIIPTYVKNLNG